MIRYLVTALRTPAFQPPMVADHLAFIDALRRDGRLEMSGAFTDTSGGAYLLKAANLDEARAVAFTDPAHTSGGWAVTVYEWDAG
jgi:uncharacterized protein YciI